MTNQTKAHALKPTITDTAVSFSAELPYAVDLSFACELLAEGEHIYGRELTRAASAVVQWAGNDCPWFVPHPSAPGVEVASFNIVEEF